MRPDEHKKKKNALYKKKHGIQTEKKQETAAGKKTADHGSTSSEQSGHKKGRGQSNVGSASRHEEKSSLVSANLPTSQDEEDVNYAKLYQRRKLDSNWQRYEEVGNDEEQTHRGADFAELLKSTFLIKPQFQFGNFQDTDMKSETGQDSVAADFLSLNCERLSEALRCIPLHQRLDLDTSLFEKSDIDSFEQDAALQTTAYQQARHSSSQPMDGQEIGASAESPVTEDLLDDLLNSVTTGQQKSLQDKTGEAEPRETVAAGDLAAATFFQLDPDVHAGETDASVTPTPEVNSPCSSSASKLADSLELAASDSVSGTAEYGAVRDKGSLTAVETTTSTLAASEPLNTKSLTELEDELESLLLM